MMISSAPTQLLPRPHEGPPVPQLGSERGKLPRHVPTQSRPPFKPINSPLSDQEISSCAYLIWEHEGRPYGRERIHWEQARAQLIATREHDMWLAAWYSLLSTCSDCT